MSSKKELLIAFLVAGICLVVGVVCYGMLPEKTPETPIRLFFPGVGGNVLFGHQTHASDPKYGLDCQDCHHDYKEVLDASGKPEACGLCHTKDSEYVPALGPKGMFNHDAHSGDYGLSCNDCHHNYTEGDTSGPDPCTACHLPGMGDEDMPGEKAAFHQQCIGCHENLGISPGAKDCSACHKPHKRMDAFHDQCIGCHTDKGRGPTKSDCKTCHGY